MEVKGPEFFITHIFCSMLVPGKCYNIVLGPLSLPRPQIVQNRVHKSPYLPVFAPLLHCRAGIQRGGVEMKFNIHRGGAWLTILK